jgi:hypothetical protein
MRDYTLSHIQADNLVTRKIAGETIVVPIKSGAEELNAIYTLNATGTEIWEMLHSAKSDQAILQSICREYDVTPEEAEKDLTEFLDSLRAAALISSSPQSGG